MSTPHELLGIPPEATDNEIHAAYRRAAMQHHPDRGGSPELFQAIQEAYEALQKRVCPDCGGKGFLTERHGIFVAKSPCPKCWRN